MNFMDELQKCLNESETELCLISKDPLNNTQIKLECGHIFNYYPLYKEVIYQKRNLNSLESRMLQIHQIKCPYCRHICNNLLPYRELDHVEKLYGINYPEKYIMPDYKCIWKFKAGSKKNTLCQSVGNIYNEGCYCNKHISNIKNIYYCNHTLKSGKKCKKRVKQSGDVCYLHK